MGYPFWVTANNLGEFNAGSSLTAQPVSLVFGETENIPCAVQLLNGTLPPGVQFSHQSYTITLKGQLQGIGSTQSYSFTFRVNNGSRVVDRTFTLTVSQQVSLFEWTTSNTQPLMYVTFGETTQTKIQAESDPVQSIIYEINNLNLLTQGISINNASGEISVDLAWKPLTQYNQNIDYMFNNGRLYVCAASGTSNSSQGPQNPGVFVDTVYPEWLPSRVYDVGTVVINDIGKIYKCIQSGDSGTGLGPTGQGDFIQDGTAVWEYVDQALIWQQIAENTTVTINLQCEAQALTNISRTFQIILVSTQAAPIWLTPPGLILTLVPEQLFSYDLKVQEPDQQIVTYSGINLPVWCSLNLLGQLHGQAPRVTDTTVFSFQVQASDQTHTVSRTFQIRVDTPQSELTWITPPELPTLPDGVISGLSVKAVSPRQGAGITYGWVGGTLPLGLRLDPESGFLQGFVEFHAQDKTYDFEIQAHDGVNTIHQTFQARVVSQNRHIHWNLYVPIWGDERVKLISLNDNSLIPDAQIYLLNQPAWGRISQPLIPIMSGLNVCTVDDLRLRINSYMQTWRISLQQLKVSQLPTLAYQTLNVTIQDAVAPTLWKPNTSYTINQRVSTSHNTQYQALNSGTSAAQEPTWTNVQVRDDLITWQLLDSPNQVSAVTTPVPWRANTEYQVSQLIMVQGVTYECVQAGVSGTSWPASGNTLPQVQDNQVVWQSMSNWGMASNSYWPSCVHNMRQSLQDLGYSTHLGSGLRMSIQIDGAGSVVRAQVTSSGSGYYCAPPLYVSSNTGSGAQLEAHIGVINAQVLESGVDVPLLTQIALDLNHGAAALLQVEEVNEYGQVTQLQILDAGAYTKAPSVPVIIPVGDSWIKLQLDMGVVAVHIINAGKSYKTTDIVNTLGQEWDPVMNTFIDQFDLHMSVAYVLPEASLNATTNNVYKGTLLEINHIQADLQGVQWQGHTRYDTDSCTWDSQTTRFIEQTTAKETVWDSRQLTWDQYNTTFDVNPIMQYPHINQTQFDADTTLFDYYATVWDAHELSYNSSTKSSWVWFMKYRDA